MVTSPSPSRLDLVAGYDPACAGLVRRLLRIAVRTLPLAYGPREFAFTLVPGDGAGAGGTGPGGRGPLRARGTSLRYTAIAVLGLPGLPERDRRAMLGGDDCDSVLALLLKRLDDVTSRGDVALLCWAAAQAGHSELPHALGRLAALDRALLDETAPGPSGARGSRWTADQVDVVSAAWIVTALIAARQLADVERHLAAARSRLLGARLALFPHLAGRARPWYRAHVGSFADQVYPVQALARPHGSGDDPEALAAAESVAGELCRAQGTAGQWWWHYDSRTGQVVEGYPVYSVHQHAMAPMALFDLADAGGSRHMEAVCRGLRWLAAPPGVREELVLDDPPVTWRKVARGGRAKLARGVRAAATRVRPGARVPGLGAAFPQGNVDRECRPYELGWLLFAWLAEVT